MTTNARWEQTQPRRSRLVVAGPIGAALVAAMLLGRVASVEPAEPDALEVAPATDLPSPSPSPSPRPRPTRSPRPANTPEPLGVWTQLAEEPLSARSGAASLWTGDGLVVLGGDEGVWPQRAALTRDGARWDAGSQRWTPIPPHPLSARRGSAVTWTDHGLFVWGGSDAVGHRGDGGLYHPEQGWSTLPGSPLPPRSSAAAVVSGDEVLVLGGWDNLGMLADGAAYDLRTRRWRSLPDLPAGFGDVVSATPTRRGPIIWAQHPLEPRQPPIARYDARRDRWVPLPVPERAAEHGTLAAVVDIEGDLYALSDPPDVLRLRSGASSWERIPIPNTSGAWWQHLVAADRAVFVLSPNPSLRGHRLDTRTMQWRELPIVAQSFQEVTAFWTGDALIVRGMYGQGPQALGVPRLLEWRAP